MRTHALFALALLPLSFLLACNSGEEPKDADNSELNEALAALSVYETEAAVVAENLATFDTLDFDVFTNEKWDRLHESHADDVIVHWPDGRTTEGIETHIDDLKALFVWAPDTRIQVHPIKLGSGNYTAVTGVMEGTFTEPMPLPDGTFIEPTGLAYAIDMATISLWTEEGDMSEEWLFWDNAEFYRQIGL